MSFRFASIVLSLLQVGSILAEDPELVVLIADSGLDNLRGALYKVSIPNFTINRLPVTTIRRPVGIDFDKGERLVYFTDLYTKQIRRVGINGESEEEVARLNATSRALGLTLDPKTRQVFYTDYGNNLIGRVEMDNFNHTVIVNTELEKPRGIVADTKKKKLYWVDFGANPKIETSDYTGQQRSTVISTNIRLPSGITLDEEDGRLYWTDFDKVESVGVDGKNRRTLIEKNHDLLFGISLFNGFLYYTDLNHTGLVSSTVNHDQFHFTFWRTFSVLKDPGGLHVYSPNYEVNSQCPYGQYGINCKDCGNCNLDAPCEKTTGSCLGTCQTGYRTERCSERCNPGTYGKRCSSKCPANCQLGSVCDFVNGTCPHGCQDGWLGETCTNRCNPGTYGKRCSSKCPANCQLGSVCDFVNGTCPHGCQDGWLEETCTNRCNPGTYGKRCSSKCPANCQLGSVCDFVNGTCPHGCQDGWLGETCTNKLPEEQDGTPVGLIVGVVVGVTVVIILLAVAVIFIIRKKKTPDTREKTTSSGVDNVNYFANNISSANTTIY